MNDGLWIDVLLVLGLFVVNIGDMLEIWISGVFKVKFYRVKVFLNKYRLFVVMFYELGFNCVVLLIFFDKILVFVEIVVKLFLLFLIYYGDYVLNKYCGILLGEK